MNQHVTGGAGRRRRRRLGWAAVSVAVLGALALLAAACGGSPGPGVAGAGSATSPGASSSGGSGSALAFSACMRAHGVKDFPDPNAQGKRDIKVIGNSDLNPGNPLFQAAQRACRSLLPQQSATQQKAALANALKYSQCMRSHGIKDFPDPIIQNGGVSIITHGYRPDQDPDNPLFQAAQQACQSLAPGGSGG